MCVYKRDGVMEMVFIILSSFALISFCECVFYERYIILFFEVSSEPSIQSNNQNNFANSAGVVHAIPVKKRTNLGIVYPPIRFHRNEIGSVLA